MGLDQYLLVRDNRLADFPQVYPLYQEKEETPYIELRRWRKHADLQGLMATIAQEKGIVSHPDEFNRVDLPLNGDDIQRTIMAIVEKQLPKTTGFFFGQSDIHYTPALHKYDIGTWTEAIAWADDGYEVIYNAWW